MVDAMLPTRSVSLITENYREQPLSSARSCGFWLITMTVIFLFS